jgi:hypothetical protein
MTRIFVRVERGGHWETVEIDQLSDDEVRAFLAGRTEAELVRWVVGLVGWIREHVEGED